MIILLVVFEFLKQSNTLMKHRYHRFKNHYNNKKNGNKVKIDM